MIHEEPTRRQLLQSLSARQAAGREIEPIIEVEELRRQVGVAPVTERLRPRDQQTPVSREQVRWRQEMDEWARSVGWRRADR